MTRPTHTRRCRRCAQRQPDHAFPVLISGYHSTVCASCQGTQPRHQQASGARDTCPICGLSIHQHWTCASCGCRGHLIPHTQAAGLCDWCLEEQNNTALAAPLAQAYINLLYDNVQAGQISPAEARQIEDEVLPRCTACGTHPQKAMVHGRALCAPCAAAALRLHPLACE